MSNPDSLPDSFPDEVPVADAVEQVRPVRDPGEAESPAAESPADAPLEASESDWQEQHRVVEIDDEDFR